MYAQQNVFDPHGFEELKQGGIFLIIAGIVNFVSSLFDFLLLDLAGLILMVLTLFKFSSSLKKIAPIFNDPEYTAQKASSSFKTYAICMILFFLIIPLFIAIIFHIISYNNLNKVFRKASYENPALGKLDSPIISLYAWYLLLLIGAFILLFASPILSIVLSVVITVLPIATGIIVIKNGDKMKAFNYPQPGAQYTPSTQFSSTGHYVPPTTATSPFSTTSSTSSSEVDSDISSADSFQPIIPVKSTGKFCNNCGNTIQPGERFCVNCGAKQD